MFRNVAVEGPTIRLTVKTQLKDKFQCCYEYKEFFVFQHAQDRNYNDLWLYFVKHKDQRTTGVLIHATSLPYKTYEQIITICFFKTLMLSPECCINTGWLLARHARGTLINLKPMPNLHLASIRPSLVSLVCLSCYGPSFKAMIIRNRVILWLLDLDYVIVADTSCIFYAPLSHMLSEEIHKKPKSLSTKLMPGA